MIEVAALGHEHGPGEFCNAQVRPGLYFFGEERVSENVTKPRKVLGYCPMDKRDEKVERILKAGRYHAIDPRILDWGSSANMIECVLLVSEFYRRQR